MPLFGIDIADYQAGIDLKQVKAEGFDFCFVKVSEGSGYVNPYWAGWRDQARANGLILAGYHYVKDSDDPAAQAANFVNHLGDKSIAAMLDFEANSGNINVFWAVVNEINKLGVEVRLSYIPRWYWEQIGAPSLSEVPGEIQSSYVLTPKGPDYASSLYPGDTWPGWSTFGGVQPAILQFTSSAKVAGMIVDADAFKGTRDDLNRLLGYLPDPVVPAPVVPPVIPPADNTPTAVFPAVVTPQSQPHEPSLANILSVVEDNQLQLRTEWPQLDNHSLVDGEAEVLADEKLELAAQARIEAKLDAIMTHFNVPAPK